MNSYSHAFTSDASRQAGSSPTCEKYCVFERAATLYAVLAMSVREVGLRPSFAAVPESSGILAGLTHLRNEFLPLVRDLTTAPGAAERGPHESQVVVILGDQGPWGLLVDRVVGLSPLDVSLCNESLGRGWAKAVMGSATLDHRIVRVLDERALYRSIADELNRHWAQALATSV